MISCQNCKIEINPKYKSSLSRNNCPSCNGEIFSQNIQELMSEIRLALEKMPNDPEGLAGWLLSNYYLKKIDPDKEVEPATFNYPRQKNNRPTQQKLTKQQQLYNQDFDPEIDLENEENSEFDTSENPFFQQAGVNRSVAETQAILKKAKQKQNNDEWDPALLQAIAKMKPETMNSLESETDFATYEDYEIPERTANTPAPKSAKEVMMRQNESRNNFASSGRSFKFGR